MYTPDTTQTQTSTQSSSVTTSSSSPRPKKKTNLKLILGAILVVLLMAGGAVGLYLSQQQQDIRQQAFEGGTQTIAGEDDGGGSQTGACGESPCAATQRKSTINGTCINYCSCGYTGESCKNDQGGTCLNDGQCKTGLKCVGGTCNGETPQASCPSGWSENNNIQCNDVQTKIAQNFDGKVCYQCQELQGIPQGQICTQTNGCICQGGPKNGQKVNKNERCTLQCFVNPPNSDQCNPINTDVHATCQEWDAAAITQAKYYSTLVACQNAVNSTMTCFDLDNECSAKTLSRANGSCSDLNRIIGRDRWFSEASACLTAKNTGGGTGTRVCCKIANVDPFFLSNASSCGLLGGSAVDQSRCRDTSGQTCVQQMGGQAAHDTVVRACQSSPNNNWNESLCTCNENPNWNCNATNLNRCNSKGQRCTEQNVGIYVFKTDTTCGSTGGGTGGGTTPTGEMCPNADKSTLPIKEYLKFTCPNGCELNTEGGVTAWRCYKNPVRSTTKPSLDGVCGQVDALSQAGNDQSYCGYVEYSCGEPRCQTNPPTTPNPSASPVGPQCLSITMSKTAPKLGETVTFTCGQVAGASSYRFRVINTERKIVQLTATGRVSAPFKVNRKGTYYAQCRVCTKTAGKETCQKYEPVPVEIVKPAGTQGIVGTEGASSLAEDDFDGEPDTSLNEEAVE